MTVPPYGYHQSGPEGHSPFVPIPYQPFPQPVPVWALSGFDPVTGLPFSEKSKVTAGLLQLLLGFFFGLGGVGRLYAGHVAIGVIQLVATAIGWVSFWCGFLLFLPFFVYFGCWLWFVIDGIVLLAGRPTDGHGRLLRS
jgi:TM2 domain-containing membrane protein YozV